MIQTQTPAPTPQRMPGPCTIRKLPLTNYLLQPEIDKSQLDLFARSPRDFRDYRDGILIKEVTEAMQFGSVAHAFILEGKENFYVRPATRPDDPAKPWNSNATACKQWLDEHWDMPVITADQCADLNEARRVLMEDELAWSLIEPAVGVEVSLLAPDSRTPHGLKARLDLLAPGYIVELKTVADARTDALSREIAKYRWHVQVALYLQIARACGHQVQDCYFIALQKGNPPRLNVRKLSGMAIGLGDAIIEKQLAEIRACEARNVWPGYSGDSGKIEEIDVPAWCYEVMPVGEIVIGDKSAFNNE